MEKSFNKTPDTFSSEVLYRFQVVSQIISLIQEENKLVDAVRMVHSAKFMDAKGNWRRSSIRTLYRWHAAYNEGGVEALKPKLREKITSSLVIPEKQMNFFKELKETDPVVSIPDMIRKAEYQHLIAPQDRSDRTTVWRSLNRMGVDTSRKRTTKKNRDSRRFAYPHRMDMIVCDGKHFRAGVKRLKRVVLFFLDDATRMALGAFVGTSETTTSFLLGLSETLLRYGLPTALFVDNGPGFISNDSLAVLAQLNILFIHGTPRYPQGHGKIERFNQTALNRVLRTFNGNPEISSDCDTLQLRLQRFLFEEYNHTPHEGIGGQTPYERFHNDPRALRFKEKPDDIRKLFVVHSKRRVSNDHIVTYGSVAYETPRGHAGHRIDLYRHLLDQTISMIHNEILVRLMPVDLHFNAHSKRAKINSKNPKSKGVQTASQVRYEQEMKPVIDDEGGCQPTHFKEFK
ncbi:MAG: DDE-type integrase/transposase/recombinase [Deltaproteobacteria bacterium]|nr:DDE-type integrase/transposase/recombinase [Deltaproteobacteria bacterium]